MAAPLAIVVACSYRAPPLRLRATRQGKPHSPPAASALVTARRWPARSDQRVQGTASARQSTSSLREHSVASRLSPTSTVYNDAATPTRQTTSASCRQKRIRRHKPSRDNIITTSLHQLSRQSTPSMSAKNYWHTWQSWQTWHAWIHYSLTTNSNRRNNFRLLSPKTRFATQSPRDNNPHGRSSRA
jgi:hypothetical protein